MHTGHRATLRLQIAVVLVGVLLLAVKFFAWRLTGSNAVLSDALESIVNVAAGSFALYSVVLAAKPRDREHPYGHGKVEFISATLEGALVIAAGALIIYRAIAALFQGIQVNRLEEGALLVAATGVVNLVLGLLLRSRGRKTHSMTMEGSGVHLLSDAWTTAALVAGLLVIRFTGLQWLDSLLAMAFAALIVVQGIRLVKRSVGGIMDETDMQVAADVVRILEENRRPAWIDLHNFRMIQFGSTLHIDCHVTLPWYFTVEAAHQEISDMADLVNAQYGREVEFFIHMDPCIERSCTVCTIMDCPVRWQPFVKRVPWTLETVLEDRKHGVE